MIYITGDTHGSYSRLREFCCQTPQLEKDDIMIVLGDTGLNYYGDEKDCKKKRKVSQKLPVTMFFIHGNHDLRPENMSGYKEYLWHGGIVYREEAYPNLLFARDGEIFDFDGKKTIVVGGAYSIDKDYRLAKGYKWFADEQPSEAIKKAVEKQLQHCDWKIDTILTHTCPLKYVPQEALFASVDQSQVDKNTEMWLDSIDNRLEYRRWFCGHFHIDKSIDKIRFLFKDILIF